MFLHGLTFAGFRGRFSTSPEEVLKTEGAARGFQNRPRNPANLNARKSMFDRYYCIKVSKKSILERYFYVLF